MTILEAVILGIVQGVTEFLPISSTAHLILLPFFLGWEPHSLRFEIVTNAGTLTAVIIYFRHDLIAACRQAWAGGLWRGARPGIGLAVAVGTVPVVAAGLLFHDFVSRGARNPLLIATTTFVFALLLAWADRAGSRHRDLGTLRWSDSLLIGIAQALALLPGTSRSGSTMTAGLALGFSREAAARFSFLLAIPVGLLALAKDLWDARGGSGEEALLTGPLVVGFAVAALSAYLVIGWLLAWLRRQTMTPFVLYRIALSAVILLLLWLR